LGVGLKISGKTHLNAFISVNGPNPSTLLRTGIKQGMGNDEVWSKREILAFLTPAPPPGGRG